MPRLRTRTAGGGWPAIIYTLRKARGVGWRRMWRALRSRNACKTCALGMGGQLGGMVNEKGRFPEVCKKSVQAMAADLQGAIHEHFFNDFSLEQLKAFSSRELEASGRLTQPLYAGPLDSHYKPISWEESIERIARKLKKADPHEAFFYFSGRGSNEAGFLMQLFARLWGTNNINNCSYFCHQASGVGLASVTGSGTATITLEDIDHCDLIFLIGANPASNHPRFMRSLVDLKRRRGKVIVINPLKEIGLVRFKVPSDARSLVFGSKIADEYVQPHIGGDIALLSGIAKALIEMDAKLPLPKGEGRGEGQARGERATGDDRNRRARPHPNPLPRGEGIRSPINHDFLAQYADGWPEFEAHIENMKWDSIVYRSGVSREQIERIARIYSQSKSAIFCWAMGITHHQHGVRNVQAIANLAIMRGMLGRPGAGLLPLRGHSNVQGMGSMGVAPRLKEAFFTRLQSELKIQLPQWDGWDTLTCLHKAHDGAVRFASCLGGNLFGSNPDANFAHAALAQIDLVTYMNTTLNTGHAWGRGRETIILPVLARDEEPEATTQESMFNYVRLSDGGERRHDGPRSEVDIIASIAQQTIGSPEGQPLQWLALKNHAHIRQLIARIIPGYEALARIDETKQEFTIPGRVFHEPVFATDTKRAQMHVVELPELLGDATQGAPAVLRLMTMRSEGQFNTVVYEEEDIYRGQERRDVILMNRHDIERFGFEIDQTVAVRSEAGEMRNILVRAGDLTAGNAAMYYPEANLLTPRSADPLSKTPRFKSVLVQVSADGGQASGNGGIGERAKPQAPPLTHRKLKAC